MKKDKDLKDTDWKEWKDKDIHIWGYELYLWYRYDFYVYIIKVVLTFASKKIKYVWNF